MDKPRMVWPVPYFEEGTILYMAQQSMLILSEENFTAYQTALREYWTEDRIGKIIKYQRDRVGTKLAMGIYLDLDKETAKAIRKEIFGEGNNE